MQKKTYPAIIAEGSREIGVLLAVFGPLSNIFESSETGVTLAVYVISCILVGIAFYVGGAILEVRHG